MIIDDKNGLLVNEIIEYDNLENSFNKLCTKFNIDDELKDFVYNHYKKEIDYFNFKLNG